MKKWILLFLFFIQSCQENILRDMGSAEADDEHYADALSQLNDQNYDAAIATVTTQMSSSAQSRVKVRELLASAYAGKCGLDFVDYTNSLAQQSTGSAMYVMMTPFVGRAADPASCVSALNTMELIGPTELRTANQNLFTSIVGMVLLGSALRTSADNNPAFGDGTIDVNICSGVSDNDIDRMILGFGFFNKNFAAVSQTLVGNYAGGSMTDVSSACNSGLGASYCQITDASQITPSIRSGFRDIINTSEYGVGPVVTGGNPMLISTACP